MPTEKNEVTEFQFQAEIRQLLNILVHSLYTNQEIFLRELISNASDALDKLRFEINRGSEVEEAGRELEVRIDADPEEKTLTVADTGVGMTREELISNIGTIAQSGSAEFLKAAAEAGEGLENIIGKFGVGFYSVFMVAREVTIRTRSYRPGAESLVWRSDGQGSFTIETSAEEVPHGTTIEVRLQDEAGEFTDKARLEGIVKRHSSFISFPIFVSGERVNTVPAIWREPRSAVEESQYEEFYRFLTLDHEAPLFTLHKAIDAPVQYNALLFVPAASRDPLRLQPEAPGLDLYVNRVLIQKGNNEILPEYLGFVRGVLDSEDLTLNISRETFQENVTLRKISSHLTKQVLGRLEETAREDVEKYAVFWKEHGPLFKLGYSDFSNREKYAGLLRFDSSHADDEGALVSLDAYIERAKPEQKEVYYAFAPSRAAALQTPYMEIFRKKGLEVLFLYEPIDEFALESMGMYKDFRFRSVEHADAADLERFPDKETDEQDAPESLNEEDAQEFGKFLDRIADILGDRVTKVKESSRLSGSPCCLVNPDGGLTSSMQKFLQIANKDVSIPAKVFEVNRDHRLVRNLFRIYKANPQDAYLTEAVEQLYETMLLLDGYLRDPHAMASRVQSILGRASDWYLKSTSGE